MLRPKIILLLAILIVLSLIVLQNTDSVEIQLLLYPITMPLAVLLLSAVMFGFVVGVILTFVVAKRRA